MHVRIWIYSNVTLLNSLFKRLAMHFILTRYISFSNYNLPDSIYLKPKPFSQFQYCLTDLGVKSEVVWGQVWSSLGSKWAVQVIYLNGPTTGNRRSMWTVQRTKTRDFKGTLAHDRPLKDCAIVGLWAVYFRPDIRLRSKINSPKRWKWTVLKIHSRE